MTSISTNTIILIAVAVLLIAVVAVVARRRGRRSEALHNPYIEALMLLIDGDRAAAFERLQTVVKSGSAPTDAYIRLGELLRERGDAGKALQIHKSLTVKTDLTRDEKVALFGNIAEDYAVLGRSDQAVTVLETALHKMSLRDATMYSILARECHHLGRVEEAYTYLRELRKLDVIGEREIALYLATVGADMAADPAKVKDAKRTLHRALKHDPDCAPAQMALGDAEERDHERQHAVDHWRRAAVLSADLSRPALLRLEKVMFDRGNFNDMGRVYREILDARPDDEWATLSLASFFKKQGRIEDAIGMLADYQAAHPHSIEATLLLTSMYAAARDTDALEKFLDENETVFVTSERFTCSVCGDESPTMRWHCGRCNSFDTYAASAR
jgi:lipopolysaccharide biosynthesis regulator YciM